MEISKLKILQFIFRLSLNDKYVNRILFGDINGTGVFCSQSIERKNDWKKKKNTNTIFPIYFISFHFISLAIQYGERVSDSNE